MEFPLDATIISEAVYANSTTMDHRHFAEEFIRRKRLADKGVIEKQPPASASPADTKGSGGWSEVAKKGGTQAKKKARLPDSRWSPAARRGRNEAVPDFSPLRDRHGNKNSVGQTR